MNNNKLKQPVDLTDQDHHQEWEEVLVEAEEEDKFQDLRPWKVEVESDQPNNG